MVETNRTGYEITYKYKNGKEIQEIDIYNALKEINEFLCSIQQDKILNGNQIKMLLRYNSTIADFVNSFFGMTKETIENKS